MIKMEEISPFDNGEVATNSIIDDMLDYSANLLQQKIPTHLLDRHTFKNQTIVGSSDGTGYIVLPSDFLRLAKFKLSEWERPVRGGNEISDDNPIYDLQKNPYLRGGLAKPIVAIIEESTETRLEYYVADADSLDNQNKPTIEIALYIKTVSETGTFKVSDLREVLVQPLSYQCAADVYRAMEMYDQEAKCLIEVDNWMKNYIR